MFATFAVSGRRFVRAVVAAWLISMQILLTASVGAIFCGVGDAATVEELPADGRSGTQADLLARVAAAVRGTVAAMRGIELEAVVVDNRTGTSVDIGDAEIPMLSASLSKLIVAVDIIDRRREAGLLVTEPDLDLIRRALGPSDDAAMNELWTAFDGYGAIGRVIAPLGVTGIAAPEDPSTWGEVTVTAAGIALVYRHVLAMPADDRDFIIGALAAAPAVAADGFSQDFGLLTPTLTGSTVAKQGWMCCWANSGYLHSAGIVGDQERYVVVLLSRQDFQGDWQPGRDRLTVVAHTVNRVLSDTAADTP